MAESASPGVTLDTWLAQRSRAGSLDSSPAAATSLDSFLDGLVAEVGPGVQLLGLGEALHGGEEILQFRNRLFERLVQAHGYTAIAFESSYPIAHHVNAHVAGAGSGDYESVRDIGFGHGFGRLEANRELIEWMRRYNAEPAGRHTPIRFYGFDIPSCTMGIASPGPVLRHAVDYLVGLQGDAAGRRQRIAGLVGEDAAWENPEIHRDPSRSLGLTAEAAALRIETEDLITQLRIHKPDLIARSDATRHREALHHAHLARQLLNYHAAVARKVGLAELLAIRDALMADNLMHIRECERDRGKVLVFAHNAHLQRGRIEVWPAWQRALGQEPFAWWSAGAHLAHLLGREYAAIGTALGTSADNGIDPPADGTLESRLTALPGPVRWLTTQPMPATVRAEIATLPLRSDSSKNLSYVPLNPAGFTDLDGLVVLDTVTYNRGGRPL